jgi:hypothetical protein
MPRTTAGAKNARHTPPANAQSTLNARVLFAAESPARSALTMPTMTARIASSPAEHTANETLLIRFRASDSRSACAAWLCGRSAARRGDARRDVRFLAAGGGGGGGLHLWEVASEAREGRGPERERTLVRDHCAARSDTAQQQAQTGDARPRT